MEYIILAIAFYCIILNCMAITMVTALKTHQRPNRPQIEHCRACNVLLIEHNHGCQWDDLKQVPIEADNHYCETCGQSYAVHNDDGSCIDDSEIDTQINIKEDVKTMNDTELLAKYNEILNEIKQRPELAHVLKKTRKVKQAASEPILEDWLQDSFPGYKSGRNKLGGGNCHVSTFTLKQANIDRINARYIELNGQPVEREMLVSKCPKCNGHFRTSFERDMSLIEEDKEYQGRIIHKLITRYTCDDCGHVEIDTSDRSGGKYLCDKNFDMVAKYAKSEPIPCPLSETELDTIEDEPIDTNIVCQSCKQVFDQDEMDGVNCPFCGSQVLVTV